MTLPVNFDSVGLDAVLADWVCALSDQGVEAVLVLGPNPLGRPGRPRRCWRASAPFAGAGAGTGRQPRLWRQLARQRCPAGGVAGHIQVGPWIRQPLAPLWLAHGYQTLVRVAFTLPAGRAFECFMFSPRMFAGRGEAAARWPGRPSTSGPCSSRSIAEQRVNLSPREQESLNLAFEGLTARETALRMDCSERTVNYHLANAMAKLQTDNKLAAVQRACWIGLI
jgi:LuxR family transcriptional regulator, quorum-sensing system regulator SolR